MNMYSNAEYDKLLEKDNRVKIVNEVLNGIKVCRLRQKNKIQVIIRIFL